MIIHDVEQGTDEWHLLRSGKPTASEASKLITSTGAPSKSMEAYAQELAGDLYAGHKINAWEGNIYTDRGHELEHEARLAYEMQTGFNVIQVGFVTDDYGDYGASPDGMIGDAGLVEIKCLPKKHISALLYYKKHGKAPPDYIPQIQFQMLTTGKLWCDLVYYHPDLPMLTIRIKPDQKIIDALEQQIATCLKVRDDTFSVLENFDA